MACSALISFHCCLACVRCLRPPCQVNPTNLIGLLVNSCGIGWYAAEKYREARSKALKHTAHKSPLPGAKAGHADDDDGKDAQGLMTLTRDGSQVRRTAVLCTLIGSLPYPPPCHPHSEMLCMLVPSHWKWK